jgi:hypothetical protein
LAGGVVRVAVERELEQVGLAVAVGSPVPSWGGGVAEVGHFPQFVEAVAVAVGRGRAEATAVTLSSL